ncbi:hypothetical protein QQF64_024078 [Cirrhinus molitorella]|uniref:C1q domain-containing protein n=1 Tax=Cirrhinus molitorella TaxID=172907 RepID=A0ABR3NLF4_9TELE
MKDWLCTLLLLETFVLQQQVDAGLSENEISQQISNEDRRQNPPQTNTLRQETSPDSQQYCHLIFSDIHTALRELTATVTEQKVNIRALETRLREQQTFFLEELNKKNDALETRLRDAEKAAEQQTVILEELNKKNDALETRLRDAEKTDEQQTVILEELNKKTDGISNLTQSQVEELRKENRDREIAFSASMIQSGSGHVGPFTTEITLTYRNIFTNIGNAYNPITGIFTAPLKGVYRFSFSVYGIINANPSTASIMKNGQRVVTAQGSQNQGVLNSSKGVVLILEVGDVVYNQKSPYVSVPIGNNSTCDITLPGNSVLGHLQAVLPEKAKCGVRVQGVVASATEESLSLWHPPVDISHLNEDQQAVVRKMLYEESSAFACDGSEIGCIPSLQMSVNLSDVIPIQHAYSSVPKPLFKEVKDYLQDLECLLLPKISKAELSRAQREDPVISKIVKMKEDVKIPDWSCQETPL